LPGASAGSELGLAEIDGDAVEPGQQRASLEGPGAAPQVDPVDDSDQRELVTLLVSPRGDRAFDERSGARIPTQYAEVEDEK
jgi:hypothetical protein